MDHLLHTHSYQNRAKWAGSCKNPNGHKQFTLLPLHIWNQWCVKGEVSEALASGSPFLGDPSGVQRSGDARGDCLIGCPLPNSSVEQWRIAVIVTGYTLFVTSQYDIVFTCANQRFGEVFWHNMHTLNFLGARIAAMNLCQVDLDKPWNYLWYCYE